MGNRESIYKGGCVLAAFFMAAMLFLGAERAGQVQLFALPFLDKVAHFVYYGLMAALLAHGVGVRWLLVPLLVVPLVGALDEWHQLSVPGRDGSVYDWMADEVGTVVAAYVYYRWTRLSREERGKVKVKARTQKP